MVIQNHINNKERLLCQVYKNYYKMNHYILEEALKNLAIYT